MKIRRDRAVVAVSRLSAGISTSWAPARGRRRSSIEHTCAHQATPTARARHQHAHTGRYQRPDPGVSPACCTTRVRARTARAPASTSPSHDAPRQRGCASDGRRYVCIMCLAPTPVTRRPFLDSSWTSNSRLTAGDSVVRTHTGYTAHRVMANPTPGSRVRPAQ